MVADNEEDLKHNIATQHKLGIHWGKTNTTVVSRKPMECNFEVEKSIVWIV